MVTVNETISEPKFMSVWNKNGHSIELKPFSKSTCVVYASKKNPHTVINIEISSHMNSET